MRDSFFNINIKKKNGSIRKQGCKENKIKTKIINKSATQVCHPSKYFKQKYSSRQQDNENK